MLKPLRIAHTSDVHLVEGATAARGWDAFSATVDAVIASQAGLFLIAGDLFDHNRIEGAAIEFVYGELKRVTCPVVLIPGNHDCFDESSVLRRMNFARAGSHVHLLSEEHGDHRVFQDLHATVWGQGIVDHAPEHKPLQTTPHRTADLWHIGMVHGLYVEDSNEYRSSRITPEEIAASGFDYLALGHVHAYYEYRHGSTLACYPGSPVPYAGTSQTAGLAIIDLAPGCEPTVRQQFLELPEAARRVA